MGRVIEEPNEEIGGLIEALVEDAGVGKVGNTDANVAGGEEDETEEGETSTGIFGLLGEPTGAGDNIESEGDGVESANYVEERGELKNGGEGNHDGGEDGKEKNAVFVVLAVDASKVENLSNNERDQAENRGIVEGEDEVGKAGGEKRENKPAVMRKSNDGIDKTEKNTAEFDDIKEEGFGV